ncbi:MAG: FKBP-type peptidyl-prolyl cis-trans isomerase [Cyclobacteriaceae bacterium]|nr:FKBP-type peptidyl-prolyl cis-trans isomerase [Cyclobacteriaceae bacterium]
MKIGKLFIIGLVGVFAASCSSTPETITTESGIEISVIQKGSEEIAPGMTMLLDFNVKTLTDSLIVDTSIDGMPRPARKVDSIWAMNRGSIEEVIYNLKNGDSVLFNIPASKLYGDVTPPNIKAEDLLKVCMVVRDAMSEEDFVAYREKLMKDASKEELDKDVAIIDAYLEENNIEAVKLESGLRYVITEQGEGENVVLGQKIKANYAGHVLNGAFFDTNIEEMAKENGVYNEGRTYGPFETVLQNGAVIQGWVEGFQYFNKGSKGTLYIPSPLGYGQRAVSPQIGANSILVFEIELLDIQVNNEIQ